MTEVRTALRRGPISQPSRPPVRRPKTGWATVVLAPIALALTVLLVAAATGDAAASDPLRKGDAAQVRGLHSTLMAQWATVPVDLDRDGTDGFLALAGDGVVHLYAPDGRHLWGFDTQDVADSAGLLVSTGGHAFGPYSFLLPESPSGYAVVELTGDAVDDLVIAYAFVEDAPAHALRSAIVRVDGATGNILEVDVRAGIAKTLAVHDMNGDGALELLVIEEDGTRHLSPSEDHWLGIGGSTQVHATDLRSGASLWSYDTGTDWGHVTAFATGVLDGDGMDLAFSVTDGASRFVYDLDGETQPLGQQIIALDGATGTPLWQNRTADLVREMLLHDMDGDSDDDVLLRVQEPAASLLSRGNSRGHVEAMDGADGSTKWRRIADYGPYPHIFDMAVRGESVPTVAVAYTVTPSAPYATEQVVRVDLMRLADGLVLTGIELADEGRRPVYDVLSTIGLGRVLTLPEDAVHVAPITGMHVVLADVDDDGLRDLIVGNDRGLFAVAVGGNDLTRAWTERSGTDPFTLFLGHNLAGDAVYTHDVRTARISGFAVATGSQTADLPLYGIMTGFALVDLNADGVDDQIFGGASGAVFAISGASGDPLWMQETREAVLDLVVTDVDSDGSPDILVVGTTQIVAIDGQSSARLWIESHLQTRERTTLRDVLFTDLNGDGIIDVVAASGARWSGAVAPDSTGGFAEVTARSGANGAVLWTHPVPAPYTSAASLAVGDFDDDGAPDLAFVVEALDGAAYHAVRAVDGQTGLLHWSVVRVTSAAGAPADAHQLAVADADGDGDDDIVVPTRGGHVTVPRMTALDGATGLTVWNRTTGSAAGTTEGIWSVPLAPGGADALVVGVRNGAGVTLSATDGNGDPLFAVAYPGLVLLTDLGAGDVDGDGIVDLIVAGPQGLAVLDGGRALAGSPDHLGHMVTHAASRVRVADFDGDGFAEVAFLADPGNAPIQHGARPFTDFGRSKGFGVADLEGIPFPIDLAPTARYLIDTVPAVVNAPVQLRSASSDLDGTIVRERWAFADGYTVDGNIVVRTWSQPGPKAFALTVIDNDGQSDTVQGVVHVRAIHDFAAAQTTYATYTAPAVVRTFEVVVSNTGVQSDTYTPRVSSVAYDWSARLVEPGPFVLAPGATKTVVVEVDATSPHPRGLVSVAIASAATGIEREVAHRIAMPMQVAGGLFSGAGPYAPTDDIGGEVRVTWYDGSAAASIPVAVLQDGFAPRGSVSTDATGRAFFVVQKEAGAVHMPGSHVLRLAPSLNEYAVALERGYFVSPTVYGNQALGLLPV